MFFVDVVTFHLYIDRGGDDVEHHRERSAQNEVVNALAWDNQKLKVSLSLSLYISQG